MSAMDQTDSNVDLLIVGAGPTGLMAAMWAATCGLRTRIIDKRSTKVSSGHADGLNARTLESLDGFGVANDMVKEGQTLLRVHWWGRDEQGNVFPTGRKIKFEHPSRFSSTALTQARVGDIMLEKHIEAVSSIRVERGKIAESLTVDPSAEFPVRLGVRLVQKSANEVTNNAIRVDNDAEILKSAQQNSEAVEVINARYTIACDGAHSWVRRQLDIPMVGDDSDAIWGVMDVVPVTDLSSPRATNFFVGEQSGLIIVPRERDLVRVYVVLASAESDEQGKLVRSSITLESIQKAVSENIKPYKLEYREVEWWAAYQIGQRCATDNIDSSGRIFLAGDAVHTHSPQAGQGLNVSMADAYNLVWKLNLVIRGLAHPKLLETYRDERLVEAQKLVNFDRTWAAIMSGKEPPPKADGTSAPKELVVKNMPQAFELMAQGLQVAYPKGLIVAENPPLRPDDYFEAGVLPTGISTGMRMPSFMIRRHADGRIQHLGQSLINDGSFRFIVFAGDVSRPEKLKLCNEIGAQIALLVQEYPWPNQSRFISPVDAVLVHTAESLTELVPQFHPIYFPTDPVTGQPNYDKVFCDERRENKIDMYMGLGHAYTLYEVDPEVGRLVIVRPDGFVGWQGDLYSFAEARAYLEGILIKRNVPDREAT